MVGRRGTPLERFERHYIPEPMSGCWLWEGSIHKHTGYGQLAMPGGVPIRAHRLSYQLFKGTIPKGLDVRHTCDVRPCVNPDHLLLGTRKQNMDDAASRGRIARGFKLPHTKVSDEQRAAIVLDTREHKAIAVDYGITSSNVCLIKRRAGVRSSRQNWTSRKRPEQRGELHHGAKLTDKQVVLIRKYDPKQRGIQAKLARRFKVSQTTIYRIIYGKCRV